MWREARMLDKTSDISIVVENWLAQFETALADGDLQASFHPDSYWRDALALSWTLQTINARHAILKTLKSQAADASPQNFAVDPHRPPPRQVKHAPADCIEAIYKLETPI